MPKSVVRGEQIRQVPSPPCLQVLYGASPEVIQFLLEKSKSTATMQDRDGSTPLHLACEFYMEHFERVLDSSNTQSVDEATVSVLLLLCSGGPCAVLLEDSWDRSALEVAIEFSCPLTAIKKLQKTAEKYWKGCIDCCQSHENATQHIQEEAERQKEVFEREVVSMYTESPKQSGKHVVKEGADAPHTMGSRMAFKTLLKPIRRNKVARAKAA